MAEQGKTSASRRRSAVVHGRLAMRDAVLEAARNRAHGLQAMAFEPLAARLAGGLLRAIDDESLRAATQAALPGTQLGELDAIKSLPGFVGAAADTLRKAWRAGIDLEARSGEHPRLNCRPLSCGRRTWWRRPCNGSSMRRRCSGRSK